MMGAIPSKITAVQASPTGMPQRVSVSRIACSPLITAQVCREDQRSHADPQDELRNVLARTGNRVRAARADPVIMVVAMNSSLGPILTKRRSSNRVSLIVRPTP